LWILKTIMWILKTIMWILKTIMWIKLSVIVSFYNYIYYIRFDNNRGTICGLN